MLQNELNKYEKKLSNLTTILFTKEKENYWLCVEINNIKSTWVKEKITLNVNQILIIRECHAFKNKTITLIYRIPL